MKARMSTGIFEQDIRPQLDDVDDGYPGGGSSLSDWASAKSTISSCNGCIDVIWHILSMRHPTAKNESPVAGSSCLHTNSEPSCTPSTNGQKIGGRGACSG
jgi:hypothetical protein